jgi:allantoin racemase
MQKIAILNPNSTRQMTLDMLKTARKLTYAGVFLQGLTNDDGPPAIQGEADTQACLPGLYKMAEQAVSDGAQTLIVGCFDDTGLATLRARYGCPVIGLGEAAFLAAALLAPQFAVVTTTKGSVPAIETNIAAIGLAARCRAVVSADIPVLDLAENLDALRECIAETARQTGVRVIILGCAGMSTLAPSLQPADGLTLVDPVRAAVSLSAAAANAVVAPMDRTSLSVG